MKIIGGGWEAGRELGCWWSFHSAGSEALLQDSSSHLIIWLFLIWWLKLQPCRAHLLWKSAMLLFWMVNSHKRVPKSYASVPRNHGISSIDPREHWGCFSSASHAKEQSCLETENRFKRCLWYGMKRENGKYILSMSEPFGVFTVAVWILT